jgi:hypothetical protein
MTTMSSAFKSVLICWVAAQKTLLANVLDRPSFAGPIKLVHRAITRHPIPYDENLLERARTQWQFGDWHSLVKLERDTLQHHPDRAKLALFAAAGHLQTDNASVGRQYIRLAHEWGCCKKLIAQILAAGVHNSLGRAAAIAGDQPRALQHFQNAIATGTPSSEARLFIQARINQQFAQLGLSTQNIEALLIAIEYSRNGGTP